MSSAVAKPRNFSAGPAILPEPVLQRVSEAVRALRRSGHAEGLPEGELSILEVSHRGKAYDAIHEAAIELCHEVIGIPKTSKVLLLQGGASLQFCMVPMNLGLPGKAACYVDTGVWSQKAIKESKAITETRVIASSADTGYDRIPPFPGADQYTDASYVHITTNNTIYGTEYRDIPQLEGEVPLVVDLSSHAASRPMALDRVGLGYAGAQKNLGPSGVTLVFIREDLLAREGSGRLPTFLRYGTHAKENSLYNTPNTFGILVLKCVLEWIREQGGVGRIGEVNARKAGKLYQLLDTSSLYRPRAQPGSRSDMNVTWTLAGADQASVEAVTKRFLEEAAAAGFDGLKGHRSAGGCRASIYNAFPEAGVDELCEFMREFERRA